MNATTFTQGDVTIDISLVLEVANGDEAYINKMIEVFVKTIPASAAEVVKNLEEENWQGLYKAAHYIKSTLSIVKVNDLYSVAQTIERHAKAIENLNKLPELVALLNTQIQTAINLLKEKFGVA